MTTSDDSRKPASPPIGEDAITEEENILMELIQNAELTIEKTDPSSIVSQSPGEASPSVCKKIVELVMKASRCSDSGTVTICICELLQRGATSTKASDSTSVSYGTATVTIGMLRTACQAQRTTVRQLARGMKDVVINVMFRLREHATKGNLHKKAALDIIDLTFEEAVWASDFQTNNPKCPERIRNWLIRNYLNRFGK